ncbi:hypothetical protein AB1283_26020 [Bacillus sp. S13(2024)]|uniref:hypothetical protein n=1 Tax=Bacillus sp. S13(2024) TaxID=3162885 RepID=UPI003D2412E2
MASEGKEFESSIEESCKEQKIYYFRVRDVNPMALKSGFAVPKNKFDTLIYYKNHLFPIEMKSTKGNKISFSESIIKANQIHNLKEACEYEGLIPGFIFNFREHDNKTYFVHINDFLKYKNIAENKLEHTYKSKVNKSSIPIGICEEIGTEVISIKKKVKFRYYINKLLDTLTSK